MREYSGPILFFDGHCVLCLWSVRFILSWEKRPVLYFCSLQSAKAEELLLPFQSVIGGKDSLLLLERGKIYLYSSAVLRICKYLRFPISLCVMFVIIPSSFRDGIYRFVAAHRVRWFGRTERCVMYEKSVSHRILG